MHLTQWSNPWEVAKKQQTLSSYIAVPPPTNNCQTKPEQKKRLFSEKPIQDVQLEANNERAAMWSKMCCLHPHHQTEHVRFIQAQRNIPTFDKYEKMKEHMNVAQAVSNKQASQAEKSGRSVSNGELGGASSSSSTMSKRRTEMDTPRRTARKIVFIHP